jgi:putative transposase
MDAEKQSRRSIRLKNYDYSQPGGYFLTIVTFQREHLFGGIVASEMQLSKAGEIVHEVWQEIPKKYPNAVLDEMVVMPNHVHGIVFIEDNNPVAAVHELPLRDNESSEEYRIRRRRMLLPKLVGYFKMNSAKAINLLLDSSGIPVWQRNYYEHIIRNEGELNRIRRYIYYNPQQWEQNDENR